MHPGSPVRAVFFSASCAGGKGDTLPPGFWAQILHSVWFGEGRRRQIPLSIGLGRRFLSAKGLGMSHRLRGLCLQKALGVLLLILAERANYSAMDICCSR